jgi:hypothetical protein
MILSPQRILLDSRTQPLMLGKAILEGLRLTDANLEPCSYQILTSMGGSKRAQGITKHKVVIKVNHVKPIDYTMVHVKTMVTKATSYAVLVRGVVLYLLGVTWIYGRRLFIINYDGK